MLPFFDFMVWPGTPWPTLYMRIRRVVLRGVGVFFVSILTWPRRELSRNTMLPLYSLVWGQNIAKFWGEEKAFHIKIVNPQIIATF